MPAIPGYEVMGWNRPAAPGWGRLFRPASRLDDAPLGALVVGDVTGKGLPAALMVSTLHSALRLLGDRMPRSERSWSRGSIVHICESSSKANKFITMLLAELDARKRRTPHLSERRSQSRPRGSGRTAASKQLTSASGLPLGLLPQATSTGSDEPRRWPPAIWSACTRDGITECAAAGRGGVWSRAPGRVS